MRLLFGVADLAVGPIVLYEMAMASESCNDATVKVKKNGIQSQLEDFLTKPPFIQPLAAAAYWAGVTFWVHYSPAR